VPHPARSISVMVVDDSAILRRILIGLINTASDIKAELFAKDGAEAVEKYKAHRPDVVLMDLEMPTMNGMEALQHIVAFDGRAKVIMCSVKTTDGTLAALDAMDAGATDCIGKPSVAEVKNGHVFSDVLLGKIRHAAVSTARRSSLPASTTQNNTAPTSSATNTAPSPSPRLYADVQDIALRPMPTLPQRFPEIIAIGSSTGGPRALTEVLSRLDRHIPPVFITQHIPDGFGTYLAKAINSKTGLPTDEAQNGMAVEAGRIYIAPSGFHLGVERNGNQGKTIRLIDAEAVNYCKPSIEVMFDSLYQTYNENMLVLLLTGMGSDGARACERLAANKSNIILAQDRASSVVWGIPGAVAKTGLCHAVLPLDDIGPAIDTLIKRKSLT
jgi:two-component system, chemotaxis family, protein-glutamate methylesterase/glutaminase